MNRNNRLLGILGIIILILVALFAYFRAPSGHQQVQSGIPLPEGSKPCEQKSATFKGYTFNCPLEQSSYTLQVSNVPDGVIPYLAPVPDGAEEAPKDGFSCPITMIGNLVFANDSETDQSLIMIFKSPIELKITYNAGDVKPSPDCQTYPDGNNVLIPVFLYSYSNNDTNFSVWKPFQNYEASAGSAEINFKAWGDAQVGVTILSVPRDFGPP